MQRVGHYEDVAFGGLDNTTRDVHVVRTSLARPKFSIETRSSPCGTPLIAGYNMHIKEVVVGMTQRCLRTRQNRVPEYLGT